ncbi:alanyl-tRNA editing protein [Fredinandcohnia sp. 179-A 10B2 NHS]|uniref:alanyl-tRNA editing protein n=1 Tax=Fredinandcohnia sp. 179-A 10B2 NHS TaxID=3235176 RepID=UPI0039A394DF
MTKKLYYDSAYLTQWTTTIKSIIKQEDHYLVTLEETAFYPEGGGQPSDAGLIGNIEVLDVYTENGEVYHKLPHPPASQTVECRIDWNRRFDHMQQHTGQHLLSAVCIDLYDAHTSSFHLGKEIVSIDLSIPELTEEQLLHIEKQVNQFIFENRELKTYFVTKEEAKSLPLRKQPEVEGDLRIVEIEGIDTSACAGTHVTRTGELGLLKLLKTEKSKGNTRVYFIYGLRALQDYQASHSVITTIATKYSTNREGLLEKLSKMELESKQQQKEIDTLKDELNRFKAMELIQNHSEPIITETFNDKTVKELQGIAKQITDQTNNIVILTTTLENKLLLAQNGTHPLHCGQIFKQELQNYNGKGGGNNTSAQAAFQQEQDLKEFQGFLLNHIKAIQ